MIPSISKFPLGIRLIIIFAVFCICAVLSSGFVFSFLALFDTTENVKALLSGIPGTQAEKYAVLFAQGVSSLGVFAGTALLVGKMETGFISKRLGLTVKPALKFIVVAVLAVLAAQVFTQFLVELNQKIPLPGGLSFLREEANQSEKLIVALLSGSSWSIFIANAMVLAVVPAIGEELFFRGLILGDLLKSKVNPAVAIISTGLLFSISHFEFDNLLAIWALGTFLGYLYYSSGSLWLSEAAHFTNNFLVILFKYLYNSGYIKSDIAEASFPLYAVVISFALFMLCLFVINKWRPAIDFNVQLSAPDLDGEEDYDNSNQE